MVWRVSFGRDDIVVCCVALEEEDDDEEEEEEEEVVVVVEARLQTMLEDEGWEACGVMGVASMAKAPKHNGGGSSRRRGRRRGRKRGRRR